MARESITELLKRTTEGDDTALDELITAVYRPLREIAHRQKQKAQSESNTLSTVGLVHDAYLRLMDQTNPAYKDRTHFYSVATLAIRHILVDHARKKQALKHGAGQTHLSYTERIAAQAQAEAIIELDDALTALAQLNHRLSKVVELRYFGGLSEKETGKVLDIDERTVRRDWVKAKAWLYNELRTN